MLPIVRLTGSDVMINLVGVLDLPKWLTTP